MFGSFLNVCIYRMPRGLSVVRPRSACPVCNAPIAAYDNVPVLSWAILRGRCRHCKAPISPRYAVVELLTGAFFALSFVLHRDSAVETARYCVFSFLIIGLIFTDAETKLLPDLLTIPGIIVGLASSLAAPVKGPAEMLLAKWSSLDWRVLSLLNSIAGALFGSAFILGVAMLYKAVRNVEGMGMGDVKLMALIGAFLGLQLSLIVLLLGSVLGSLFGGILMLAVWRKRLARRRARRASEPAGEARARAWQSARLVFRSFEIPFGVFLGVAAMVSAFWGAELGRWYMGLYQ